MKRILVFGITENPGGVESVIMNYYRKIDRTKIQFDFLCNTKVVAYEDEIVSLGGKIYRIAQRKENAKQFYNDLDNLFKNNKFDAIWVNVCSLANIEYLKYAKKYGIKTRIIHSHNSANMDSKLRAVLHTLNRFRVGKLATHYWSCGDLASKWFYNKKIIQSDKHKIINNAIDIDKFKFDEKIRNEYRKNLNLENKFIIGHVGRFHFQKNQLFLIDVFNEIYKQRKDVVLVLIGQGEDEDKIKAKVKELNLEEVVKFLGVKNDVNNYYQIMDMFLFPSVFEGFGIVAIESQVAGVPTLCSTNVPLDTKLTELASYHDLKDMKDWVDSAVNIIDNYDKKIKNRAEVSKTLINSDYDINRQVEEFEKLILEEK